MTKYIGELGMALLAVTGMLIGFHLAAVVIFGVSLIGVLWWLVLGVPAFMLALVHPNPKRWDQR